MVNSTFCPPQRTEVVVRGGTLAVGLWGPEEGEPVLLVHGVNGTHMSWGVVAQHMLGNRLIAPDLRGRGRSSALPGPWGLAVHVEDLITLLDALSIDRVTVVGHSMGGSIALMLAQQVPDRVSGLVLAEGGLTPPTLHGDPERIAQFILRDLAERLKAVYPSLDAYFESRRDDAGLQVVWTEAVRESLAYDLSGTAPSLRFQGSFDAVAQDAAEMREEVFIPALVKLRRPAVFLRAMLPLREGGELYEPERWTPQLPNLESRDVAGVNHYTLLISEPGVTAIVDAVRTVAVGVSD